MGTRKPPEPVPFLPWADVHRILCDPVEGFLQGDHVAILGPTGTGKTHIALEIAELRTYSIAIACKRRDPLIEDALKRGYHLVPSNRLEIPHVDGKPLHRRWVFWPRLSREQESRLKHDREILRARKALQKPAIADAIGYVYAQGGWCLIFDEGTWVCRDLHLQEDVDHALFEFRTRPASIIILGQRPAWMGRYVLSQPTHVFLFQTSQRDDAKALGDISGVNYDRVRFAVERLDHRSREALYLNTRTREMFRTIAPPR